MIPITTFPGRTLAVFGMARSGLTAAHALLAGGAKVACWDDGERARGRAQTEGLPLVNLTTADWSQFAALVVSPGVPLTHPEPHWTVKRAQAAGIEVIGDTELFFRELARRPAQPKVVGITGTNGKSTTTALTAHVLREAGLRVALGGNIGEAILGLPPMSEVDAYVIEFSSYQIDLTPSIVADAAALLNITPDHLDRHGTIANYATVKARIFSNMGASDTAVIGVDDEYCRAVAEHFEGRCIVKRISVLGEVGDGVFARDARLYEARAGAAREVADLNGNNALRGSHNWQNAAAAFALARGLGLDEAVIRQGLASFPGLAHRMEVIGRQGRVLFVNDSKATNADAAAKALAAYETIYWIAGGLPKEGGIESLRPYFPKIRGAYLIGQAGEAFAATLGARVPHEIVGTLDQAVRLAAEDAAVSDEAEPVVLLSPACASFDQFSDFEHRGNAFRSVVNDLPGFEPVGRSAA